MEIDASNDITYYIKIKIEEKNWLRNIRHLSHLKMAFEEDSIWIKGFTLEELTSIKIMAFPFKKCYYAKLGKIFPLESKLPTASEPTLLWTDLKRALSLSLPSLNYNFFTINHKIPFQLIPSIYEQKATWQQIPIRTLAHYLEGTASIRTKHLKWILLNKETALLQGEPMLPLNGDSFWQMENLIIPTGWAPQFPSLSKTFEEIVNPLQEYWIFFYNESQFTLLQKNYFTPLSLASCRLSYQPLKDDPI